ncbi:MAG: DUF805 domain-containing protein [Micrococcales bacterium]|nr:DUF805 domain-containing protein [Micrococcales bacterium]
MTQFQPNLSPAEPLAGPGWQGWQGPPPWPPTPGEPPSKQLPWYGIGFVGAIKRFYGKYADFKGRASRSEYWWAYLYQQLIYLALLAVWLPKYIGWYWDLMTGSVTSGYAYGTYGNLFGIFPLWWQLAYWGSLAFGLANVVPNYALGWRRMHDAGLPGPYFLLGWIPFAGFFIQLAFCVKVSSPEGLRYDLRADGSYHPEWPPGYQPPPMVYGYPPPGYGPPPGYPPPGV